MFDALLASITGHKSHLSDRADAARRRRRRPYAHAATAALESLEQRMFLSASISVLGNGHAIANGSVTVSRTNFTDFAYIDAPSPATAHNLANDGGTVTRQYTIQNNGTTELDILGRTITGSGAAAFGYDTIPAATIAAGSSTTFVLHFKPTAPGTAVAQINIASNDPAHPFYSFIVLGTGLNVFVFTDNTGAANGLKAAVTLSGTGKVPTLPGQQLRMTYTGYLTNGTVFDSSDQHPPGTFDFLLGAGQVIRGWDQGLQNMVVGDKRVLVIPYTLGYGTQGNGSNIPGFSTLIFEVQLVAILGPSIQVTGKGVPITDGATRPSAANDSSFGAVIPNTSLSHTFTITNPGSSGVVLLGASGNPAPPTITISGANAADFSITVQPALTDLWYQHNAMNSDGSDLPTSTTFTVSYNPTHVGASTAVINIVNNSPLDGAYHFTVSGAGVLPSDLSGVFANSLTIPPRIGDGDKLNVPVTITNTGPNPAKGAVQIIVKASPDGTWHDADPTLGTLASQNINLALNGSTTATVGITIPPNGTLTPNGYFLVAKIIPVAGITQDGSANNIVNSKAAVVDPPVPLNVVLSKPDLTVTFGTLGPNFTNYVPGDTITIPVTIRNAGIRPAVASTIAPILVDVRSSANNVYDGLDALIKEIVLTSSIAHGASVTQNVTFKIPSTIAPGSIYIVASADTSGVVDELDETNNTANTGPLNILWQFGAVPGRSGSVPLTLTDVDGTIVKLQLSGPGTGTLVTGSNGFDITLLNTTTASTFTITTTKTSALGDDGRFTLDNLTVGDTQGPPDQTSIGAINAKTTDLSGNITITGAAGAITWGNIAGQHNITIGTPLVAPLTPPSVKLTFGTVDDLTLNSAIGIASLTATDWQDTQGTPDSITAPWLTTLKITGDTAHGFAGDLMANLTLTAVTGLTATSPTLGSASIAGSVGGNSWAIAGSVGTLAIGGTVGTVPQAWQLSGLIGAKSITLGDVTNAQLTATGAIGTLSSKRWLAGSVSATTLGTLKTLGQTGLTPFTGDFAADLTLTGPASTPTSPVLGTVSLANHILAGTWNIAGAVTSLTAKAIEPLWQGNFTGAAGNIATLNLTDAAINNTVNLTANSIGTFTVAGGLNNSSLTLNQGVSLLRKALGSLNVGHDITASAIRAAGNIGAVKARSLTTTLLFAGVQPSVNALPTSAADFVDPTAANLPTIASLTLTGFPLAPATPVFTNSDVAAGKITSVHFPSTDPALIDPSGVIANFGFATRLGVTTYTGPLSSGFYISGTGSVVN